MADDIRVKRKKLSDYPKQPNNHNKGSERGKAMIAHSFEQYGAGRSLLADRDGVLIAGNQSIDGAAAAGITDVIEVTTTGNELVVVRREDLDLDDPKAIELAYLDNRSNQVSLNFDAHQIAADIENGVNLSQMWTPDELMAMVGLNPLPVEDVGNGVGDGTPVNIPQQYMVIVECDGEQQQVALLERLTQEGYTCRALLS